MEEEEGREEWRDRGRKGEKKKRLGKLAEKAANTFLPLLRDRVSRIVV